MANIPEDDNFLARWLGDQLTPDELEAWKSHPDYSFYEDLRRETTDLSTPDLDVNTQLARIRHAAASRKKPAKSITWRRWVAAAIGVVILAVAGVWLMQNLNTEKSVEAGLAEHKEITLPDGSVVALNASTQITYNPINFKKKRIVNLTGEAFFDITSGAGFKVITDYGSINVLGTRFNVISRKGFFEVGCVEGSLLVLSPDELLDRNLEGSQTLRVENNEWKRAGIIPMANEGLWRHGESKFVSQPLTRILEEIERQYAVNIDKSAVDGSRRMTGTIPHDNIQNALDLILSPMRVSYEVEGQNIRLFKDSE